MNQDEDHCWVGCDIQSRRDAGEDRGRKKQNDEEGGGGVCPGCGRKEEVSNSIWR